MGPFFPDLMKSNRISVFLLSVKKRWRDYRTKSVYLFKMNYSHFAFVLTIHVKDYIREPQSEKWKDGRPYSVPLLIVGSGMSVLIFGLFHIVVSVNPGL